MTIIIQEFIPNDDSTALERFRRNRQWARSFSTSHFRQNFGITAAALKQVLQHLAIGADFIFPSLDSIDVLADSAIPLFMPPSIHSVVIAFNIEVHVNQARLQELSEDVVRMMPDIKSFVVEGGGTVLQHDDIFADLFIHLQHLHSLSLPRYVLTPLIFHTLRQHPCLNDLVTSDLDEHWEESVVGHHMSTHRWTTTTLSLPGHGFTSLTSIGMSVPHIRHAQSMLEEVGWPGKHLVEVEFFVAFPRDAGTGDVTLFARRVGEVCPVLRRFILSLYPDSALPQDLVGIEPVGYDLLEAVSRFPHLRQFRVEHALQMQVTDKDIGILAPRLAHLTSLSFNQHPLLLDEPHLSILAVAHFAVWCDKLDFLGLYFSAQKYPNIADLPATNYPVFEAKGFTLDVGLSPTPLRASSEALLILAEYLARMLPSDSEVQTGYHDCMFDSQEFSVVPGQSGALVLASEEELDVYHQTWDIVHTLSTGFRPYMPVLSKPVNASGREKSAVVVAAVGNDEVDGSVVVTASST